MKLKIPLIFLVFVLFTLPALAQQEENLTITTYYPSPYGNYNELRSRRMAIGDTYYKRATVCWDPPCPLGSVNVSSSNPSLLVEGNVGIGTAEPNEKLTVVASRKTTGSGGGLKVQSLYGSTVTEIGLFPNNAAGASNALVQAGDNILTWRGSSIDNLDAGGLVIGPWSLYPLGIRISPTGNVGIGTTSPGTNKLKVVGGTTETAGGLIIEKRTTNPSSPEAGRMWLCTDTAPYCE